jgi:hypothetical protein
MKRTLLMLISLMLLNACSDDLQVKLPDRIEQQPVLNSLFTAGEPLEVSLSTSSNIYGKIQEITGANVDLYENGEYVESLYPVEGKPGYYKGSRTIKSGNKYEVIAQTSVGKVSARELVPEPTCVRKVEITRMLTIKRSYLDQPTKAFEIQVTLDKLKVDAYFRFRVVTGSGSYAFRAGYTYKNRDWFTVVVDYEEALEMEGYDYLFVPSKAFNQDSLTFSFYAPVEMRNVRLYLEEQQQVFVEVKTISRHYYEYVRSYWHYAKVFEDSQASRLNVHSNTSTNMGIFAGGVMTLTPLKLPAELIQEN